ncbi:MAG: J domain-containing protein [Robiginitomaculum sp.]
MADSFSYRPKGIDIRIKPTGQKLKDNEKVCDWSGCVEKGGCKAPKSPDRLRDYYNFCAKHAREYNKNWNFFSGMSDDDISEWQVGARHGHRPTWDVKKNTGERAKGQKNRPAGTTAAGAEGYNIFGNGDREMAQQPRRRLTKLQLKALSDLGLDEFSGPKMVRERYTQLVKQLHPDAGGSESSVESFQRVVKAYKVLKTTDLA